MAEQWTRRQVLTQMGIAARGGSHPRSPRALLYGRRPRADGDQGSLRAQEGGRRRLRRHRGDPLQGQLQRRGDHDRRRRHRRRLALEALGLPRHCTRRSRASPRSPSSRSSTRTSTGTTGRATSRTRRRTPSWRSSLPSKTKENLTEARRRRRRHPVHRKAARGAAERDRQAQGRHPERDGPREEGQPRVETCSRPSRSCRSSSR